MKANVTGVKQRFLFAANQDARRTERVAGVEKFQRRRRPPRARLVERRPFDFAIVFEALELRREVVHLVVRVERIFADAQLVALARHHVHRIVQHALDDEVAQFAHQHVRLGKMPARHRQRADVVVMAMRNRNRVHLGIPGLAEQRQPVAALAFRVHPGVEQNAVVVHLHQPRARADVRVGIQIRDVHRMIKPQMDRHATTK